MLFTFHERSVIRLSFRNVCGLFRPFALEMVIINRCTTGAGFILSASKFSRRPRNGRRKSCYDRTAFSTKRSLSAATEPFHSFSNQTRAQNITSWTLLSKSKASKHSEVPPRTTCLSKLTSLEIWREIGVTCVSITNLCDGRWTLLSHHTLLTNYITVPQPPFSFRWITATSRL